MLVILHTVLHNWGFGCAIKRRHTLHDRVTKKPVLSNCLRNWLAEIVKKFLVCYKSKCALSWSQKRSYQTLRNLCSWFNIIDSLPGTFLYCTVLSDLKGIFSHFGQQNFQRIYSGIAVKESNSTERNLCTPLVTSTVRTAQMALRFIFHPSSPVTTSPFWSCSNAPLKPKLVRILFMNSVSDGQTRHRFHRNHCLF